MGVRPVGRKATAARYAAVLRGRRYDVWDRKRRKVVWSYPVGRAPHGLQIAKREAEDRAEVLNLAADPDDYERRYLTDPVFRAQVNLGAQALLDKLEHAPSDAEVIDAKEAAFTVLAAVDAAMAMDAEEDHG